MPDLNFEIESVDAPPYSAVPLLSFRLRVSNATAEPIHAVILRAQLQIAATRRRYEAGEQERLLDLFGTPDRWRTTLKSLLWTHVSVSVPAFTGSTTVELPVPCTYDFEVGAAKYLYALEDGEVPLLFLFSGTVFYEATDGALQVEQISWEKEAPFRLPVRTWQQLMEAHFPGTAWLRLGKDAFDRLYQYRARRGLTSWDEALAALLPVPESVGER